MHTVSQCQRDSKHLEDLAQPHHLTWLLHEAQVEQSHGQLDMPKLANKYATHNDSLTHGAVSMPFGPH